MTSTPRRSGTGPARTSPSRDRGAAALLRPCGPIPSRSDTVGPQARSSAWFVQMLDVAFSRRMCCSASAASAPSNAGPAGTVSPTSRPGTVRRYASRHARIPRYGPPCPAGAQPLPFRHHDVRSVVRRTLQQTQAHRVHLRSRSPPLSSRSAD